MNSPLEPVAPHPPVHHPLDPVPRPAPGKNHLLPALSAQHDPRQSPAVRKMERRSMLCGPLPLQQGSSSDLVPDMLGKSILRAVLVRMSGELVVLGAEMGNVRCSFPGP